MLPVFIDKHIRSGYFRPTVPKEFIFLVATMAMNGIMRAIPFTNEVNEFQEFIGLDEAHRTAQGMAKALSKFIIDSLKKQKDR